MLPGVIAQLPPEPEPGTGGGAGAGLVLVLVLVGVAAIGATIAYQRYRRRASSRDGSSPTPPPAPTPAPVPAPATATPARPFRIFLNYRREDSQGEAGRLYDSLREHFSSKELFMDVDAIEPGLDFVDVLEGAVASCDVLLALMGRDWATVSIDGRRRLDNPSDFVRLEIAAALRRNVRVVPVLVHGTTMPPADALPDDLKALTRRAAIELSHTRWRSDVTSLVALLQRLRDEPSA